MSEPVRHATDPETTPAEIQEACGRSRKWVSQIAKKEGWPYREQTCLGGRRRLYPLDQLPGHITSAVQILRIKHNGFESPSSSDGDGGCVPVAVLGTKPGSEALNDRANGETDTAGQNYCPDSLWAWYERQPDSKKEQAKRRLTVVHAVHKLASLGVTKGAIYETIEADHGVSRRTFERWLRKVKHYHRSDWMPALCPGHVGRTVTAQVDVEAWEMFKGLYLDRSARALSTCYRRVQKAAKAKGWAWPSQKTVERKLYREVPYAQRVYLRQGPEALDETFPTMSRDRSDLHALQAVNGDGLEFHPAVLWPDGSVNRCKVWFWQDIRSGKILSWRADQSENKDMLRLAVGDLVERYGIPQYAFIDNTTAAASKWLTGGIKNRYRWKIKDEDPRGIMVDLGIDVRFTLPAHGQSKPIERAYRDLRELMDKHPKWNGRGTQARPIPLDEFLDVLQQEVTAHNAQTGRRGGLCNGRSFDQVFAESYEHASIRKATADQRRLWMLAAERVRAKKPAGAVVLGRGPQGENRYWCEQLGNHVGDQVVVRFDPQRLQEEVHVYTLDGRYIGAAECVWRGGFIDTETARAYHRARSQYKRHTKHAAAAQVRMNAATAAREIPRQETPDDPESSVVQYEFRRKQAVGDDLVGNDEDAAMRPASGISDEQRRQMENNAAKKIARLQRARRNEL